MMNITDSILDQDIEHNSKNRTYFKMLLVALVLAVSLIIVSIWLDLKKQRHISRSDIVGFSIVIIVPIIGVALLAIKKKLGWIISLFYYQLLAFLLCAYWVQLLIERRWTIYRIVKIETAALFILSALSVLFLLNKEIRAYLTVTQKMLLWTLSTVTAINLLLSIALFKS